MRLKPCPNRECLSHRQGYLPNARVAPNGDTKFQVICLACGARGGCGETPASATRIWNTRASGGLEGAIEVVEKIRQKLRDEGLHSSPFVALCDKILAHIRALPDSGEVEALALLARQIADDTTFDEDDFPTVGYDGSVALVRLRNFLAGPKP